MSKNLIIGILVFLVLLGTFAFGYYRYPRWHPCPEPVTNTITIRDTIIYYIPDTIPFTVVKIDSIIYRDTIYGKIDTLKMLADYFADHYYTRNFNDSLLSVTLKDVISENKFKSTDFKYKILRPQQIINKVYNSTVYNKYLYVGGTAVFPDSKYSSVGGFYATERILFGAGYIPASKGFNVSIGFRLAKF